MEGEEFVEIIDSIRLQRFTKEEIEFCKEYVLVMGVVADALDVLQGDLAVSVGYLLPTLYELRKSFEEFNQQYLKFCQPLNKTLKEGFNKRFESFFGDEKYVTFYYFRFKLAWLKNDERNNVKNMLKDEFNLFSPLDILSVENIEIVHSNIGKKRGFFSFEDINSVASPEEDRFAEFNRFFNEGLKSSECLAGFPIIKKIYLHYNTDLPSSALVERLFSLERMY
ncbi:hypothetical protein ACI65C_013345 [Semiaphis heraclei]